MRWASERVSPRPRPMRSCPSKGPAGRHLLLEPEAQVTRSVPAPVRPRGSGEAQTRGLPRLFSVVRGRKAPVGPLHNRKGEGRMQTEFTPQTLLRCSLWAKHCIRHRDKAVNKGRVCGLRAYPAGGRGNKAGTCLVVKNAGKQNTARCSAFTRCAGRAFLSR